jgi:hypothetical protein
MSPSLRVPPGRDNMAVVIGCVLLIAFLLVWLMLGRY